MHKTVGVHTTVAVDRDLTHPSKDTRVRGCFNLKTKILNKNGRTIYAVKGQYL